MSTPLHEPEEVSAPLACSHEELGIEPPVEISSYARSVEEQLVAVLEEKGLVFSFTFDVSEKEELRALKAAGALPVVRLPQLVGALALKEVDVDTVVAQGAETDRHPALHEPLCGGYARCSGPRVAGCGDRVSVAAAEARGSWMAGDSGRRLCSERRGYRREQRF